MALLLSEYQELTNDMFVKGVIEELIEEFPLQRLLPWKTITGSGLTYNREDEDNLGEAAFYNVGDNITPVDAHTNQKTAAIYKIIRQAEVDDLAQKSMSDKNDQMAVQLKIAAKKVGQLFERQAWYGVASQSKGFDGLHAIVADSGATQKLTTATDATGKALSMSLLDEAIDNCRAGKPDAIICSRRVRRNITQHLRSVGSYMTKRDDYGRLWEVWGDDIPLVASDALTDTELCDASGQFQSATGGATSSLFVVKFGEDSGLVGLQSGGIETIDLGYMETRDAIARRIRWYVGLALYSTKALVRICNITNAIATA